MCECRGLDHEGHLLPWRMRLREQGLLGLEALGHYAPPSDKWSHRYKTAPGQQFPFFTDLPSRESSAYCVSQFRSGDMLILFILVCRPPKRQK